MKIIIPSETQVELKEKMDKIEKLLSSARWTYLLGLSATILLASYLFFVWFFATDSGGVVIKSIVQDKLVSKITNPFTFLVPQFLEMTSTVLMTLSVSFFLFSIGVYIFVVKLKFDSETWVTFYNQTRHVIFIPATIVINASIIKTCAVIGACIAAGNSSGESIYYIVAAYLVILFLYCCFLKAFYKLKIELVPPKHTLLRDVLIKFFGKSLDDLLIKIIDNNLKRIQLNLITKPISSFTWAASLLIISLIIIVFTIFFEVYEKIDLVTAALEQLKSM